MPFPNAANPTDAPFQASVSPILPLVTGFPFAATFMPTATATQAAPTTTLSLEDYYRISQHEIYSYQLSNQQLSAAYAQVTANYQQLIVQVQHLQLLLTERDQQLAGLRATNHYLANTISGLKQELNAQTPAPTTGSALLSNPPPGLVFRPNTPPLVLKPTHKQKEKGSAVSDELTGMSSSESSRPYTSLSDRHKPKRRR